MARRYTRTQGLRGANTNARLARQKQQEALLDRIAAGECPDEIKRRVDFVLVWPLYQKQAAEHAQRKADLDARLAKWYAENGGAP
jgi:hypothetical protein